MHQIGFDVAAQLAPTLAGGVALLALPCTIVITLMLIRLFPGRVARSMRATAAAAQLEIHQHPTDSPKSELRIERIGATKELARAARVAPLVADTRRHAWHLAAIHAATAAVYPLLLAVALIIAIDFAPTQDVALKFALLYATFVLELATPAALAPAMVLGRQPRFLILAVLGLLALMWAWDQKLGVNSIGLWLMIAAVPTELLAAVPVDRIVLLVDASTDLPFLERTLEEAWQVMPAGSPNREGGRRLRVLEASASDRRTLSCLLGLLCERPVERALAA